MRRNKKAGSWATTGEDFSNTPILVKTRFCRGKDKQVSGIGTNLTQFNK